MNKKIVGVIINEAATKPQKVKVEKSTPDHIVIRAVLQDFVKRNRNRRYYKESSIVKALKEEHIQEMIDTGTWYGENGHPLDTDIKRQMTIDINNASHVILSYKHNPGENIEGVIRSTMFPAGIAFRDETRLGAKPAFSMRGMGPVVRHPNGDIDVGEPLKILTYDNVRFPSHKTAYMKEIISESASLTNKKKQSDLIPFTEDALIDFLNEKSDIVKSTVENLEIDTKTSNFYVFKSFNNILLETTEDEDKYKSKIILNLDENLKPLNEIRRYLIKKFGV